MADSSLAAFEGWIVKHESSLVRRYSHLQHQLEHFCRVRVVGSAKAAMPGLLVSECSLATARLQVDFLMRTRGNSMHITSRMFWSLILLKVMSLS